MPPLSSPTQVELTPPNASGIDLPVFNASTSLHTQPPAKPFFWMGQDWPRDRQLNPIITTSMIIIHAGALVGLLASPWTVTIPGLVAFAVLYFLSGCVGITLCYHRLLTHQSFEAPTWFRRVLAFIGSLALEGGPVWWVATHRLHHKESDQPNDPHSPRHGFWWAHMAWVLFDHPQIESLDQAARLAPDIAKDPFMLFLDRQLGWVQLAVVGSLMVLGYSLGGWQTALSMLFWGGFIRIVAVWHLTWLVNSATHVWGYQNYQTTDDSRNHWLLALITFGEGWHNNHHAHQRAAKTGRRWFEIDMTYGLIKLLSYFGLARKLVALEVNQRVRPLG